MQTTPIFHRGALLCSVRAGWPWSRGGLVGEQSPPAVRRPRRSHPFPICAPPPPLPRSMGSVLRLRSPAIAMTQTGPTGPSELPPVPEFPLPSLRLANGWHSWLCCSVPEQPVAVAVSAAPSAAAAGVEPQRTGAAWPLPPPEGRPHQKNFARRRRRLINNNPR